MRAAITALMGLVLGQCAGYCQNPQANAASPLPWEDVASWANVHPTETDNIIFANVPLLANPSASPDPGTPNGIRTPIPEQVAPGTMNLHVDVYQVPSSQPTPVVVQFHGGGWIRGDRPTSVQTFSALLAAGMSVVAVQYRNAKDAPAPAAIEDVRCAMAWVKANAARFNFDLSRVVTYGGSAGGHLALMAAYAPASFDPPGCTDQPKVAAVLDFYGPANLAEGLTESGSSDFTHQWLGTQLPLAPEAASPAASASAPSAGGNPKVVAGAQPPAVRRRWPEPDAATILKAKEMSPLTYVRPGMPPTFIVNGDSDHTVDPTQSAELKKALDAAGVPNGQDLVLGGGHGGFSKEESDKAMLLCLRFLEAHGILPAVSSRDGAQAPGVLPNGVPPPTPAQANLPQNNLPNDPPLDPKLPTLFIVGDSTARNGLDLGWGDHLAHYFDTTRINVANRARAGRSSRSYIDEGLWQKTLAEIKPGDYVLLQWGHNDGGDLGGAKPRGDLAGDGDATEDVPQTTGPFAGQTETIHTYGWYNRKYVADIEAKGATPIFLSMTIRDIWTPDANGVSRIERENKYNAVMKKIADEDHLAFIDMAAVEAARLEATGEENAKQLFPIDHTHTSSEGAELNAQSVVISLEVAHSPLAAYLKAQLPLPQPAPMPAAK
ncbi:MAG: alpha/beta hydrolase fold domain-containing protein [Terracidiphilus sp.]|nr:alpha/beta hydrolase fold domain-containing protein [Terracidiphilus sp.]MDR3797742.1 alpha/beta hydrolase fold domain-containing protein [Terracidiphilus sp.]